MKGAEVDILKDGSLDLKDDLEKMIENIDIGGLSLIRAAASKILQCSTRAYIVDNTQVTGYTGA